MLIDSGVPRSATAPAQLALDRAIAAETGGGRDDEQPALVSGADARPLRGVDRGVPTPTAASRR